MGAIGDGNAFSFDFPQSPTLECLFLAPDTVRMTWGGGPEKPSAAVVSERLDPETEVTLRETVSGWSLSSSEMALAISWLGQVDFFDAAGCLLRRDDPPQPGPAGWRLLSQLHPEERLHGLGLRSAGLNLRPGTYRQWNRDPGGSYGPGDDPLYLCIPVLLGRNRSGSYLLFFDNPFEATFSLSRHPPRAECSFSGGPIRYYVSMGPPKRLLEGYTELTGRPPLPPRWALGFHQSRWGYRGQGEVRSIVQGFRNRGLPLEVLHLDIDHLRGYRVFTVDKRRFPSLPGLAEELREQGVRLVSIVDPGVKCEVAFPLYREGRKHGYFCFLPGGEELRARVWPGWCAFPDYTCPRIRHWWGEQYESLLDQGVSGFWHDMNEPATFEDEQENTFPLQVQHHLEGYPGDHREGHNVYGLTMARAGYDGLRRLRPEKRPWILSRSGWAGLQRYAWNWTGDVESSWEALRMSLPSILNLGLSGIPFSGPDIGGFSGSPSRELFLRWFQLAAFLPFFRNHAAWDTEPREPWRFGTRAVSIVRDILTLRSRLLPYLYTLCWEAAQWGYPPVRPLFWDIPADPSLGGVQDAFLLGSHLLVAPALEDRIRRREVQLPPGAWYHFWDDALLSGGCKASLPAPLERIPLLVQAGTVLPMERGSRLKLHIYPPSQEGQGGESRLYSDAGDGFGASRLDRFRLERGSSTFRLLWTSQGSFPWPYREVLMQLHGFRPKAVQIDGIELRPSRQTLKSGRFTEAIISLDTG